MQPKKIIYAMRESRAIVNEVNLLSGGKSPMLASSYTDNWVSSNGDVSFAPQSGMCGCIQLPAFFTLEFISKALNSFEFNEKLLSVALRDDSSSETYICFCSNGKPYFFDGFSVTEYLAGTHAAFLSNKKKLLIFHDTGVFAKVCEFPQSTNSIILSPNKLKQYLITISIPYQNQVLPRRSELDLLSNTLELDTPQAIITSLYALLPDVSLLEAVRITGCFAQQKAQAVQTLYLSFMIFCCAHTLLKGKSQVTIDEVVSLSHLVTGKRAEAKNVINILESQDRFTIIENKVALKPKNTF
jgi:hypothetical protein